MRANAYVVFRVTNLPCALPSEQVRRVLPIPLLSRPPACPSAIEGILNLGGVAVPVVRLDRLFGLEPSPPHAYQHLVLLRDSQPPLALLVDRVTEVLRAPSALMTPMSESETFNGCVVGQISMNHVPIQVLSSERLLDRRERQAFAEFQAMQQRRLEEAGEPS